MERKWWTLAGTCAGLFLLMLDSTVVALALPSIRHDVGASSQGLQWVMNGYLLAITVFVVTAGRLGDMFGRKRLFLAGTVVFALGSAVSGAAGDELTLIGGRVLQGIGAAPMLPLSLAIVCNAFPNEEQARALGIWAGISASGAGDRPARRRRPGRSRLAGDLLDQPAGRGAGDRDHGRWRRPSRPTPARAAKSTCRGWRRSASGSPRSSWPSSRPRSGAPARRSPSSWSAPPRCYGFWRIEHRSAEPIVDFTLFRNGPYFGASAAAFALVGAYWSVMFFQSQYLQDVRGHSAVLSGLLILPITVPMIFISPLSGRLIARFGARRLMTAGMGFAVARPARPHPGRRRQPLRAAARRLPALRGRPGLRLRADVDRGDGGDARRQGRDRLRGAGDGPGDGGDARAGRDRRPLARPARRRQRLRRRDRRLDLDPGRARRGRHRADLDVRPRRRPARGTTRGTATRTSEARSAPRVSKSA